MQLTITILALFGAFIASVAALPTQNASALSCVPFGPKHSNPNGRLEFIVGYPFFERPKYGYPGNPMYTQGNKHTAWEFFTRTCNSSSLNLYKTRNGDNVSEYVQFVNTKTGNCMTWDKQSQDIPSYITFEPCNHAPIDASQFFFLNTTADQYYPDATVGVVTKGDNVFSVDEGGYVRVSDSTDEMLAYTTWHSASKQ